VVLRLHDAKLAIARDQREIGFRVDVFEVEGGPWELGFRGQGAHDLLEAAGGESGHGDVFGPELEEAVFADGAEDGT